MYERLLDKNTQPTLGDIHEAIGNEGVKLLDELEKFLYSRYDISAEMRFPFGDGYGWGKKYSHKSKHLCYVFFEKGAFTVTIQLGKNELSKLNETLPHLSPEANELWRNRYPCGDGGWIHYRVLNQVELRDVEELICIKKRPIKG